MSLPLRLCRPLAGLLLTGLVGCSSGPAAWQSLGWQDAWGDRGEQVRGRDLIMCAEAVESRRSLLADCMVHRGWRLAVDQRVQR
jgi:hypothetical protein